MVKLEFGYEWFLNASVQVEHWLNFQFIIYLPSTSIIVVLSCGLLLVPSDIWSVQVVVYLNPRVRVADETVIWWVVSANSSRGSSSSAKLSSSPGKTNFSVKICLFASKILANKNCRRRKPHIINGSVQVCRLWMGYSKQCQTNHCRVAICHTKYCEGHSICHNNWPLYRLSCLDENIF